jgi:hypothetical protein
MEQWKNLDFVGCSHHEVSNEGHIRCISTGRLVKFGDNHGYYRVSLTRTTDHKQKHFLVARLVAIAFIPNPENKPEVDHIDGDRHNNSVNNLRWTTHHENCNNQISIDRMRKAKLGDKNPMYRRKPSQESIEKHRKSMVGKHWKWKKRKNISTLPLF